MASFASDNGTRRPPTSSHDVSHPAIGSFPNAATTSPSQRSPILPHPRASPPRSSSSSPASSTRNEAGRSKTEQVVLEFLYKVTELIVQSRVNLQAEPALERGTRRSRFNLDIEEIPFLRESMAAWRERVQLPLTIDIFLESSGRRPAVLLERWSVVYAGETRVSPPASHHDSPSSSSSMGPSSGAAGSRDVIQQLKEVCKKISVLLRALYSFMRQLPAHVMYRQAFATALSYKLYAPATDASNPSNGASTSPWNTNGNHLEFEADVAVDRYSFLPVVTPFGFLKLSTVYRRHCDLSLQANEPGSILEENCIITDYVPSSPQLQGGIEGVPPLDADGLGGMTGDALSNVSSSSLSSDEIRSRKSSANSLVRRRSDPTQFTSEDDADDLGSNSADPASSQHRHSSISQPMAIPQCRITQKQGYEDQVGDNPTSSSKTHDQAPHAHSYGDPETVRSMGTNPNVAADPYGYGNVAIHQTQEGSARGWGSNANLTVGSHSSNSSSHGAMQESSPHPLATPPLHPNSLHTTRSSRASLPKRPSFENFLLEARLSASGSASTGGTNPTSNEPDHENDGLSLNESGNTAGMDGRVRMHGASLDENDPIARVGLSSSPYMTPPFSYASHGQPPSDHFSGVKTAHSTGEPNSNHKAGFLNQGPPSATKLPTAAPFFSSSPPFRVNPSEFLSTSPGFTAGGVISASKRDAQALLVAKSSRNYVHSSNALELSRRLERRHQRENTDSNKRVSRRQARPRGFSADYDGSSRVWGVSPDNGAESFAFPLARPGSGSDIGSDSSPHVGGLGFHGDGEHDRSHSRGKARARANSLAVMQNSRGADSAGDSTGVGDLDAMLLPFAIGDLSDSSVTATPTTTSTSLASDNRHNSRGLTPDRLQMTLETATVGNFLAQIKNAPKLHLKEPQPSKSGSSMLLSSRTPTASPLPPTTKSSSESVSASDHMALFDEELESFRLLRDELAGSLS